MLTSEQRIKQMRAYLVNQRYVQVAYIFGSAAKGTMGPLSDVDVAVLFNSDPAEWYEQRMKLTEGLVWIFGVPKVDIVVLNSAEPVLAHRAVHEGQLVFVRDEAARVRTERNILNAYLDTAFLRKINRASISKHIEEGEYFG